MEIIPFFIIVFCLGFLLGLSVMKEPEVKKEMKEEKKEYYPEKTCRHDFEKKRVLDVDGSVWRNVCKRCGHSRA